MMGRSAYFSPSPGIRLDLLAGNICGFCGFCRTFAGETQRGGACPIICSHV
ncbi:hypothetical protein CLIM01_13453 [Colletotrichum limetticola]|uniref:Uncharacterized protein n=1 Tax=Colletotrichum limetticola TaxID=1209924 RepID=A0ABQ9PDH3_9PEZI|nr:hypothetical protein CLIM01_13453 [Colletotrichum limetticola]